MEITIPYALELDLNRFRSCKINRYTDYLRACDDPSSKVVYEKAISFWQDLDIPSLLSFAVMEACWRYEK